jgi:hypothetical protein
LKCCTDIISKPLTFICNSPLASGIYPERFKFTIVCPIHKKEDKTKMTNYRPISLVKPLSKISETLIFNTCKQTKFKLQSSLDLEKEIPEKTPFSL